MTPIRWGRLALGLPILLLLVTFFILPYGEMVAMSFRAPASGQPFGAGWTLVHYARALGDGFYLWALGRSLLMGLIITLICLLASYPLALHLARVSDRWHLLFYACIVSPLLVGVLVRNFGWMIILAVDGPLNRALMALGLADHPYRMLFNEAVVVLALVHVFVPFMVLPITNALRHQDPALRDASASLGASRLRTFLTVTLPLSFPGVQSGVILVFLLSVSAYVTPALLGGQGLQLMPSLIVQQLVGSFAWPFGGALAVSLALAMLCTVVIFTLATRRLAARTTV